MLWLKGCPRCHGDLTMESDVWGRYVTCLQCGGEFGEAEMRRAGLGRWLIEPAVPARAVARSEQGAGPDRRYGGSGHDLSELPLVDGARSGERIGEGIG